MNKTTNYNLNQWGAGDRVLRTDFNSDNAKIDVALAGLEASKAEKTALAAIQTKVDGALQYATGSYVGTDTFGSAAPNSLTFPFKPLLVALSGDAGTTVLVTGAAETVVFLGVHYAWWKLSWSGNSVSWYVTSSNHTSAGTYPLHSVCQMNEPDKVYHYIAIGTK